ncbi:MAG: hypothetical protein U9O90_01200 [Euryarchaeota archaeon]|nr:hypothetical protein [Euryarchaeota archaeon]
MKKKTVGLIVMLTIVTVAMFAGCIGEEQANEFSALEIAKTTYENGQVKVFGITDLPDGAELMLSLDTPTGLCAQGRSKVKNGKFTLVFGPFIVPYAYDTKPYKVNVLFLPHEQSDRVIRLVGEKGEYLTGDLVEANWNRYIRKIMEVDRYFNTQFTFPTEYPTVDPNSYKTGTPERVLAEWLNCWKQEEWNKMVELTSKTRRNKEDELFEIFEINYYNRKLVGAEIIKKETDDENLMYFETRVYYLYGGATDPSEKVILIDVVRERAPYTLSSTGKWGVDPIFF